MRTSIILSAFLHLLILAVVLINYIFGQDTPPLQRPVAVSLLSPSDVSQTKAGSLDKPRRQAAKKSAARNKKQETHVTAPKPKSAKKAAKKEKRLPRPPKHKPKSTSIHKRVKVKKTAKPKPKPKAKHVKQKTKKVAKKHTPKPRVRPVRKVTHKTEADRIAKLIKPSMQTRTQQKKPKKVSKPLPKKEDKPRRLSRYQENRAEVQPEETERKPSHLRERQFDNAQEEKRRKFDPNQIAALLNRDPDAGQRYRDHGRPMPWRRPSSFQDQANGATSSAGKRSAYGQPSGRDERMSADEIDAFIAQISRCWAPPVGGLGNDAIVVKLHIELKKNGTLAEPPRVVNNGASRFFRPAADSAMRAVLQCQPYRMQPQKFSQWRSMVLNFDPKEMHGG